MAVGDKRERKGQRGEHRHRRHAVSVQLQLVPRVLLALELPLGLLRVNEHPHEAVIDAADNLLRAAELNIDCV